MIVECPTCKANVNCTVIAHHDSFDPEEDIFPFRASLLECPSCKNTILAGQNQSYEFDDKVTWDMPTRLWPSPKRFISWSVPAITRSSIEEADRCFRAGANIACAVMCGRAIEGICRHYKTKSKYLGDGLKELLDQGVIDSRLYSWGQELQRHRNIGAHATNEKISREDAQDLLDFVIAICEYVFVLNQKFQEFMNRKKEETK